MKFSPIILSTLTASLVQSAPSSSASETCIKKIDLGILQLCFLKGQSASAVGPSDITVTINNAGAGQITSTTSSSSSGSEILPQTPPSSSDSSGESQSTHGSSVYPSTPADTPIAGDNVTTTGGASSGNPFEGKVMYANSHYYGQIEESLGKLPADVAAKAQKLKEVSTALWMDTSEAVPKVSKHLQEAAQKQKSTGKAQVVPIVVYNLPLRDCAAAASAGQFTQASLDPYKKYIESIVKEIQKVPELSVVAIVEPDSLPNLVTNVDQAKCAKAKPIYMEGVALAVKALQMPNVAIYLDIAHAGWLGWDSARAPAAKIYAEVMKMAAPAKIRGFATNVANYNVIKATTEDPVAKDAKIKDESSYVQAMSQELQAVGLPTNFIIDTSRSGTEKSRTVWGNWCNIKKAGLGPLPKANPGIPNVDAFVWVKPPGESDGVSDTSASRYDQTCTSADSFTPSPQAGVFNPGHFALMVKNANPPL